MERSVDVVVLGAGSAGFAAAAAARKENDTSSILLVNEEDPPPYDRRLLSKSLNSGNSHDLVPLADESWFQDKRIDRIDGVAAVGIQRDHKTVTVGDQVINYGSLVIATGAIPIFPKLVRTHELGSFFVVRNVRDLYELKGESKRARTVLVAGMGVLAVEVAHQLIRAGKKVTLAGATPQLMPRQLSARSAEILEDVLTSKSLKLFFHEEIISFEKNKKRSWSVEMLKHSGHFDMVVFCIGVTPRTDLAGQAGLAVGKGVIVDEHLRTDDPAVFAAGDCAELPDGHISYLWEEAAAQGAVAGTNAAGGDARYDRRPFPLRTTVFGLDIYSIGKPRTYEGYRVEEFEVKNRYYGYYWSPEDILKGAIVLNDPEFADRMDSAVRDGWDRETLDALRRKQ
ncbi:MAG: FAD-dependent oxidoreductase [Alkalispirochaeta sp.]|jgi:NAD(P)H-nitrite reductase large subunit